MTVWRYAQRIWLPPITPDDIRYPRARLISVPRRILILAWGFVILLLVRVGWIFYLRIRSNQGDIKLSDLAKLLWIPSFMTDVRTPLWMGLTFVLLGTCFGLACLWAVRDEIIERQVVRARRPHDSASTVQLQHFLIPVHLVCSASAILAIAMFSASILGSAEYANFLVPSIGVAIALCFFGAMFVALALALLLLAVWKLRDVIQLDASTRNADTLQRMGRAVSLLARMGQWIRRPLITLRLHVYGRYPRQTWKRTARTSFLVLWLPLLAYLAIVMRRVLLALHATSQFWQSLTANTALSLAMVGGLSILRGDKAAEITVAIAVLYVFSGCAFAFTDRLVEWYVEFNKARWRVRDLRDGPRLLGDSYYRESRLFFGRDAIHFGEVTVDDALSFGDIADHLTDYILRSASNTPLVVSIEAEWGTGKTTLMRMVQRRVDRYRFVASERRWEGATTFFMTWRYEAKDAQIAFLGSLFRAAPTRTLRWYVGPFMRGRLIRAVADLIDQLLHRGDLAQYVSKRLAIVSPYELPLEEDFRELLDFWLSAHVGKRTLLIMFIDDVDRSGDNALFRLFDMLKLYFDYPGVAFVLGFDPNRINQAVGERFPGTEPNDYLEKFLSYRYPLPSPQQSQLRNLIRHWLDEMCLSRLMSDLSTLDRRSQDELLDALIKFSDRRLRRIKLTLNCIAELLAFLPDPTPRDIHVIFVLALIRQRERALYVRVAHLMTEGQMDAALEAIERFAAGS